MVETKEITVEITEDDIRQGIQREPYYCPIARAARRATGMSMVMGASLLHSDDREPVWGAFVEPDVIEWMGKFDKGEKVEPFTFTTVLRRPWSE